MILFYINSQNNVSQARIIRNFFRGYTGEKELSITNRFSINTKLNERASLIVFAGFIRGDGLIYNWCKENKKNFLYVDHAYVDRGYNPSKIDSEWMRITCNDFCWNKNEIEPNDRWNKHFAHRFPLMQWNSSREKSYILVLPPSEACKVMFPKSIDWTEKAIIDIKKRTSLPIRIREKPIQPKINPVTNAVIGFENYKHMITAEKEMLSAKLIVTYNSGVPALGTINGIPCYVSENAAAYPMSINLDYLNSPPEPDRQAWLNQLVYHQYTTGEMRSGKVWNLLQKYIPR
jgi:hypothetical protein